MHWNPWDVMMSTLVSLATPEAVAMRTYGAGVRMKSASWRLEVLSVPSIALCFVKVMTPTLMLSRDLFAHIFPRVTSITPGQPCVCNSAMEAILKSMSKKTHTQVFRYSDVARLLITLISSLISEYIPYKLWDEINYPFPNINGAAVEVREWVTTFIPRFTWLVITHPCRD